MIQKEDYILIGQTLKTLVSQSALLYTLLNKIHWVRQADQLLQYKTALEQLSYSLEHKMSKDYSDEDIKGVFF